MWIWSSLFLIACTTFSGADISTNPGENSGAGGLDPGAGQGGSDAGAGGSTAGGVGGQAGGGQGGDNSGGELQGGSDQGGAGDSGQVGDENGGESQGGNAQGGDDSGGQSQGGDGAGEGGSTIAGAGGEEMGGEAGEGGSTTAGQGGDAQGGEAGTGGSTTAGMGGNAGLGAAEQGGSAGSQQAGQGGSSTGGAAGKGGSGTGGAAGKGGSAGTGGVGQGGAGGCAGAPPDVSCTSQSNCNCGQVCSELDNATHQMYCQPSNLSGAGVGESCSNNNSCLSNACSSFLKTCTIGCTTTVDCGGGNVCNRIFFTGGGEVDLCLKGCQRDSDCPVNAGGSKLCVLMKNIGDNRYDFSCIYPGYDIGDPLPGGGTMRGFGEKVSDKDRCYSGLTTNNYCSRACENNSDCAGPLPNCGKSNLTAPSGSGTVYVYSCRQ